MAGLPESAAHPAGGVDLHREDAALAGEEQQRHLAAVDGLYIHLWRLRLHARPETRREHWLHTARALLFPPVLLGLFALPTGGVCLWTAITAAVLDRRTQASASREPVAT